MRKLLAYILCLVVCFSLPQYDALAFTIAIVPPAPVAGQGCTESNNNTANVGTANSIVTAGDIITLEVNTQPGKNGSTSITNGTGATGLVWQHAPYDCTEATGSAGSSAIWYAVVVNAQTNGAAVTVTTDPTNTFTGVCIIEWSGLANPVILDPASGFLNTSSTASANILGPIVATSYAEELLLSPSSFSEVLTYPCTASNGGVTFTGLDCGSGGDGLGGSGNGYYITSSTGTYQSKMVMSLAGAGCVVTVGFVGAGQSLPVIRQLLLRGVGA